MSGFTRARHLLGQAWLGLTARWSGEYWEKRYRLGMSSGSGSEGELARMKAEILNAYVRDQSVRSVIEFGCGDGQQLALANYPSYLGLDVSRTAVELCTRRFAGDPTRTFLWYDESHSGNLADFLQADLTLSLDVIYHLLEDDVYRRYLTNLFSASRRHVVVYSSNVDHAPLARHVRHRRFVDDVGAAFPTFRLTAHVENPLRKQSFADFYFFSRTAD
jgi:SAM-dependent methyltransferase